MMLTFIKGENLSARKMTALSEAAHGDWLTGNLSNTGRRKVISKRNSQNYIEPLRPFDVERTGIDSVIVRGGARGKGLDVVSLTVDDVATPGDTQSSSPEDFRTITISSPVADTEYSVYLSLEDGELTANMEETSLIVPSSVDRLLTQFTTDSVGNIPDIDVRITDGGDDSIPYHFEVIQADTTHAEVRGGWWAYYEYEEPTQVDLEVAGASYDDTTGALSTVTGAGVVYLELDLTDPYPVNYTLTAKYATDAAWAALVDTADIYRKLIAEITWDATNSVIDEIRQDWLGGNILYGFSESENAHSFHWDRSTLTILPGYYTQEGDGGDYAAVNYTGITNPLLALPSVATRYYLKVTWNSTTDTTVDSVELLSTTSTTPTNTAYIWYFDVMEFDSDGVCTEHKQDDLILPESRVDGGVDPENDHSFHYRGDGNMTVGGYRIGEGNNVVFPTPTASNYYTLSNTTDQAYWMKVDYSSATPAITFQQGSAFPNGAATLWIYPLIEFNSSVCTERQQGNIQLPNFREYTVCSEGTPTTKIFLTAD
ncbi:MAG: hypothetical protein GY833_23935 [Aestuariibacter sp.]|nr:hypothetical protein [Aestuariibacter sp.]